MDWIRDILEIGCTAIGICLIGAVTYLVANLWNHKNRFEAVIIILAVATAAFYINGRFSSGSENRGYFDGYVAGYEKGYENSREDFFEGDSFDIDNIEYDNRVREIQDKMNKVDDNGHEW